MHQLTSILCFGSQIWGNQYVETLEKVHIQFCKKIFCYMLFQLDESGGRTRATFIKDLLFKYGFGHV